MFATFSRSVVLSAVLAISAAPAIADESVIDEAAVENTAAEVVFVSAAAPEAELEAESDFRQEVTAMVESDLMLDLVARLAEQRPAS